jgi:hypothetical protein
MKKNPDTHSTTHLSEAQVVTLRDEGTLDPWVFSHLDGCGVCVAEVEEAKSRTTTVSEALGTLDVAVDVAAAKAAVRRRLDLRRPGTRPALRRLPLGRAATFLLVTAGAAAALPWSPLARWWSAPETTPPPSPTATQTATPAAEDAPASIAIDVADHVEVVMSGVSAGSTIDVVWNDGRAARVSGPSGSRFTLATSRIEVEAAEGSLRVELPRARNAVVVVNGRTYLEHSLTGAGGTTVVEPAAEVTDAGVRFLVREP